MPKWSGFHKLSFDDRLAKVKQHAGLSDSDVQALAAASALPGDAAASFVENVVGTYPLPLGFAVGFTIDGEDTVVPMAVEESSVIAAACNGAKLAGNITTKAEAPITIGQVEVRAVQDADAAHQVVRDHASEWRKAADVLIPSMVQRGGGCRRVEGRLLGNDRFVVHFHVDTRDAMGANVVNAIVEALGPRIAEALGGRLGLRILSNHATGRLVWAQCKVPVTTLGGKEVATAMVEADEFARVDPYRAATHNKGIMNGIDPVAIATGNDWRAIEAGAHAWAARSGHYQGLTQYHIEDGHLLARLELPLSVGTVGGVTRLHPVARASLAVLGDPDALRLARIMAAVGLAQNLAALRALSAEGIQAGHMALHARNVAMAAGASGEDVARVAKAMVDKGTINTSEARRILSKERP